MAVRPCLVATSSARLIARSWASRLVVVRVLSQASLDGDCPRRSGGGGSLLHPQMMWSRVAVCVLQRVQVDVKRAG